MRQVWADYDQSRAFFTNSNNSTRKEITESSDDDRASRAAALAGSPSIFILSRNFPLYSALLLNADITLWYLVMRQYTNTLLSSLFLILPLAKSFQTRVFRGIWKQRNLSFKNSIDIANSGFPYIYFIQINATTFYKFRLKISIFLNTFKRLCLIKNFSPEVVIRKMFQTVFKWFQEDKMPYLLWKIAYKYYL